MVTRLKLSFPKAILFSEKNSQKNPILSKIKFPPLRI
jgi:hypothetical protein